MNKSTLAAFSDKRDAPGSMEKVLPGQQKADATLRFIGTLRTPFLGRDDCPRQGDPENGPECRVVLDNRYVLAMQGIERMDRIELIYWLHGARRDLLTQGRKSVSEPRGTFTLRSPVRPNPIGISVVTLIRREANILVVRGLDCLNGTPLLDIKPVRCACGGAA